MLRHCLQDLNFIIGGLQVVRSTFLYFQGNICVVLEVFAEPDCGEVAPSDFLYDYITIYDDLSI